MALYAFQPASAERMQSSPLTIGYHTAMWRTRYSKSLARPSRNGHADQIYMTQNPGQTTYASSVGVMGTTIDAAKLVLTSLLSTEPWVRDPNVVKIPWNHDVETSTIARAKPDGSTNDEKPLKIGIFYSDDVVGPHPPVRRGLQIVHDVLKHMGHKVKRPVHLLLTSDLQILV